MTFARGDRVVITAGLSKGRHGEVLDRWFDIRDWVTYRVKLDGERGERVMRADFLALASVETAS